VTNGSKNRCGPVSAKKSLIINNLKHRNVSCYTDIYDGLRAVQTTRLYKKKITVSCNTAVYLISEMHKI